RDGNPILNVNDEPIQPPLTRVEYDEQANVSFYTIAPDFPTMDLCRGKSNDATVTLTLTTLIITVTDPSTDPPTTTTSTRTVTRTFAPETLKLDSTTWGLVYDSNGDRVVQVNLVFLYKKDTWVQNVPQISFYKQDENGTRDEHGRAKLYPITERDIGGNT